MTLIKSISGIRGTIGDNPGENLTPIDIVEFVSAYGMMLLKANRRPKVVVGRDGRISGPQVQRMVNTTLLMCGIDVINLGLSTTPTVEMEVLSQNAAGGIIITASHNGMEYNALKFLDHNGECINATLSVQLLDIAAKRSFSYAQIEQMGQIVKVSDSMHRHIDAIINLPLVNENEIKKRRFKIVADCINSTGSLIIPILCKSLGCDYVLLNEDISGSFAHNPEPLEQNLAQLSESVRHHQADLGIAVDPDVDRLAFVDENGRYCGEEYTLVMVADYILSKTPGPTVSNLSSTKALRDVTESYNQKYFASAVGEVNVVHKIKSVQAVIGGEGNGGIIYPELHHGRDALVGIALLLSSLASKEIMLSEYRDSFPNYVMVKDKIQLNDQMDIDGILKKVAVYFQDYEVDVQDGVKVYMNYGWVHLRKSNTEPILRLYAEELSIEKAESLADSVRTIVQKLF